MPPWSGMPPNRSPYRSGTPSSRLRLRHTECPQGNYDSTGISGFCSSESALDVYLLPLRRAFGNDACPDEKVFFFSSSFPYQLRKCPTKRIPVSHRPVCRPFPKLSPSPVKDFSHPSRHKFRRYGVRLLTILRHCGHPSLQKRKAWAIPSAVEVLTGVSA